MANTDRIDTSLFEGAHYLGKPADFSDKIISRRVDLTLAVNGFAGKDLDLVEIGCGNGASMILLAPYFKTIDGLEYFEGHQREFEQLKNNYQRANLSFEKKDIENSTPEKQYDRMISFEVYEHLQHESSISFYFDILKPGGMAAITVPNKWWIFETHGANLPFLPWNRVPFFSWLPTFLHERWANARIYTKGRISKILVNAGFVIEDIQYITAPMDVLKEGWLKRFLLKYVFNSPTTRIPFKSTSIFIVVKKPSG
jgi:cyclopropane fatty-acyl-phospholipid synthase-like methyltransferase